MNIWSDKKVSEKLDYMHNKPHDRLGWPSPGMKIRGMGRHCRINDMHEFSEESGEARVGGEAGRLVPPSGIELEVLLPGRQFSAGDGSDGVIAYMAKTAMYAPPGPGSGGSMWPPASSTIGGNATAR